MNKKQMDAFDWLQTLEYHEWREVSSAIKALLALEITNDRLEALTMVYDKRVLGKRFD